MSPSVCVRVYVCFFHTCSAVQCTNKQREKRKERTLNYFLSFSFLAADADATTAAATARCAAVET